MRHGHCNIKTVCASIYAFLKPKIQATRRLGEYVPRVVRVDSLNYTSGGFKHSSKWGKRGAIGAIVDMWRMLWLRAASWESLQCCRLRG